MKDKHYLYRVAVTCYVDSLFYETGNARRCHERCHSLITQTLCGIGKSTCRNYLRYDRSELLAEVRIPPALKELLHLYVLLVTKCPQTQTAALLQELRRLLEIALRHAGRQGSELTADSLIEWLRIPSRRNKAPASDPRRRTAAGGTRSVPSPGRSHESEDRITAKNKTRCRVLFFCLTPNVRRRSCRKGYFRAARPGRRAS